MLSVDNMNIIPMKISMYIYCHNIRINHVRNHVKRQVEIYLPYLYFLVLNGTNYIKYMNSGDDLYRYASMYTRQNSFGESILGEARKKDWNIKIRSMLRKI